MTSVEQTGEQLVRGWFEQSPFMRRVGLRLAELEPGRAVVELPFDADLATVGDVIHGGAISTLIDSAAAAAAWAGHTPRGERWGTVGMTVNFMAAARGRTVTATATVSRRGSNVCFCRIEVSDSDGKAIAEGLVTYRLG
jgi:uncharacterized protein (TIGR00369 family)